MDPGMGTVLARSMLLFSNERTHLSMSGCALYDTVVSFSLVQLSHTSVEIRSDQNSLSSVLVLTF